MIPSPALLGSQNVRFSTIVGTIILVLSAYEVANDPSAFNESLILHSSVHVKSIDGA